MRFEEVPVDESVGQQSDDDELLPEYDFTDAVRGKYAERYNAPVEGMSS